LFSLILDKELVLHKGFFFKELDRLTHLNRSLQVLLLL
jgi:hypothetical protein